MAVLLSSSTSAQAQSVQKRFVIKVPDILEIQSGIEASIPIELFPKTAIPKSAMLLLKGIPTSVSLPQGRLFESGVWAIKSQTVPAIRILTSHETPKNNLIAISLVTLEGEVLSEKSLRLIITPRLAETSPPKNKNIASNDNRITTNNISPRGQTDPEILDNSVPGHVNTVGTPPSVSPADKEKISILLTRGHQLLAEGKINAARLFYQKAAELKSAEAALAVAKTYDPNLLKLFPILGGIEPNLELAELWYNKAAQLGSRVALNHLDELKKQ
jgi:hypothetical protein